MIEITSASVVDNLDSGLYGYVGGSDFGIGIGGGIIEVLKYSGYKVQRVTTFSSGMPNRVFSRTYNNGWSTWKEFTMTTV